MSDMDLDNNIVQSEWLNEDNDQIDDWDDDLDDEWEDEFSDTDIDESTKQKLNVSNSTHSEFDEEFKAIEETTKNKRKKKVVDPFIQVMKTLSSISARNAKYAIFNLNDDYTDCIVTMTGKSKMTFEEYLLQYEPGSLGINILYFKKDQLQLLKNKFCIEDIDRPVLVNLEIVRKAITAISKYKTESLSNLLNIAYSENNESVYISYKKELNGEDVTHISRCAFIYKDWRSLCILTKLVNSIKNICTSELSIHRQEKYDTLIDKINQNILVYQILTIEYKNTDGNSIFNYVNNEHKTNLIYIQGKDIISLKEYVKKLKTDYTLDLISCVNTNSQVISYMSLFENDDIKVLCSRPKAIAYPFVTSKEELIIHVSE